MKHLFTSLSICIMAAALTACKNESEPVDKSDTASSGAVSQAASTEKATDIVPENQDASSRSDAAKTEADKKTKIDKAAEAPVEKSASDEKPQVKPLNLDDFRSAIDEVVQDSFQEEVENTVESEVSKKAGETK